MISRRRLLVFGTGATVLLAAGGIGLALQPTIPRAPKRPLKALTPLAYATLAAVADRVCPGGDGLPRATELDVPEKIDDLLDAAEPGLAVELNQLLGLLENALAGLLVDGRTHTFTNCSPEVQDRVLANWRSHRFEVLRTGYRALSGLVGGAYWGDPRVHAYMGYDGPWFRQGRPPPLPYTVPLPSGPAAAGGPAVGGG